MAWYVVYRGKVCGVYETWAQCNEQVSGFPNNYRKKFATRQASEDSYFQFIHGDEQPLLQDAPQLVANNAPWVIIAAVGLALLLVVILLVIMFG